MANTHFLGYKRVLPLIMASSCIGSFTLVGGVQAQEASIGSLEEVVVTAMRRSQSLQDVPASVSALTGEQLNSFKIERTTDLADQIPNVQIEEQFGLTGPRVTVRGIVNADFNAVSNTPVTVYSDDVVLNSIQDHGFAMRWLESTSGDEPFFLYLSHKAVHGPFIPANRHKGQYEEVNLPVPDNQNFSPQQSANKPRWVKDQRNSFVGVDFPYHTDVDITAIQRDYRRSLSAVDDSLGRILDWIEARGITSNTAVIFMGDNGFLFGEHGLIDKRNAYEESMRIPLLASFPGAIASGTVIEQMVANIDIAPTVLDIAGVSSDHEMHGMSMLPLAQQKVVPRWRTELLYEYFWEWTFPQTPTTYALRQDRYKLIQYHGVWDTDELYDLVSDPGEKNNLIHLPEHRQRVRSMRESLYSMLINTQGLPVVPYTQKQGMGIRFRDRTGTGVRAADFPQSFLREPNAPDREDYKE